MEHDLFRKPVPTFRDHALARTLIDPMPSFTTRRRVRHGAPDMFALVADIEHYPEFVPLCRSTRVSRRTAAGEGVETLRSEMTVAYKMIRETFVTQVTLDRPRLQIHVKYLEGPFSHLENRWSFRPLGEQACEVEFFISYEFRSRALGFVMGAVFDAAFRRFAEAFERRADVVFA
jgi:coenzyme Q-binding protein COQ10